jgi:hypothetical protein
LQASPTFVKHKHANVEFETSTDKVENLYIGRCFAISQFVDT